MKRLILFVALATIYSTGTQFTVIVDRPDYGIHAGDTVTKQPEGYYRSDQDPGQYIAQDTVEDDTTTYRLNP